MTPKTKRNLLRVLPFGLIWLFFALIFLFTEYAATGNQNHQPETAIQLNPQILGFAIIAITLAGLLVGTLELLYINRLFAKQSLLKTIIFKLFIYAGLLFLVILIAFPIAAGLELDKSPFSTEVLTKFKQFLGSITFVSTSLQLSVSLGVSLFYAEISEHMGHGVLLNFFTGKYHLPKEERRIFMFLDMKSSTTIAEKLGHVAYFNLLKSYYYHLSDAIVRYSGEVYQYVGDEVVISWKYQDGIKNNNCIKCFFAMKADLEKHKDWYLEKFGTEPSFKAALHLGKVTTGEIGALKKEIIFTGDVLNTTARIQALCNTYKTEILISDHLLQWLTLDQNWATTSLGTINLRGKTKNIILHTIALDK